MKDKLMENKQNSIYYGHKSLLIVILVISLARCSESWKNKIVGILKQELVFFNHFVIISFVLFF